MNARINMVMVIVVAAVSIGLLRPRVARTQDLVNDDLFSSGEVPAATSADQAETQRRLQDAQRRVQDGQRRLQDGQRRLQDAQRRLQNAGYRSTSSLNPQQQIRDATAAIRDAEDEQAKAEATQQLKSVLHEYFEADMAARRKGIDEIEERLQKLKAQLAHRNNMKQEIIGLQLQVAINEANGLGFYSQPQGIYSQPQRIYSQPQDAGLSDVRVHVTEPVIGQAMRAGAKGRMVEALQRTLNARIQPPPNIVVDGDFGPETQNAVRKFQSQSGLPDSGVVDPATWKALGMGGGMRGTDRGAFGGELEMASGRSGERSTPILSGPQPLRVPDPALDSLFVEPDPSPSPEPER